MVKHIVVWKLKDFADGRPKEENLPRMKEWLEGMETRIPVIRRLEAGINCNDIPGAFDVVLFAEFDSLNDLQIYQDHPEHVRVRELIRKVTLEKRSIDYE